MTLVFDFGRSMNPAFSIYPRGFSVNDKLFKSLPILNVFNFTRHLVTGGLLIAHTKDFYVEVMDLYYGRANWDELKPEMQKTAIAIACLTVSLTHPYVYLVGSETYELISRFRQFDLKNGALSSASAVGGIFLQSLHLFTLLAESPSWKDLEGAVSGQIETEPEDKEALDRLAPVVSSLQKIFSGARVLPLIFRNAQELSKTQSYITIVLLVAGRYLQARMNLTNATTPGRDAAYLAIPFRYAAGDVAEELYSLTKKTMFFASVAFSIVELATGGLDSLIMNLGGRNYHIGATGAPVKMDDVVGCKEAKEAVLKVIDRLKNPNDYAVIGPVKATKGILFFGAPGTGKSMLAKAFATAADNAKFIEQMGSSFVQIYVGQGPKNIRALFSEATRLAKEDANRLVVVFIDEINAIAAKRTITAGGGGEKEFNSTTEAFLVEMDKAPSNVIIIGATNARPEELDDAFVRAGRFDEHIEFKLPKTNERVEILTKLSSAYKLEASITEQFWKSIASQTEEWSYADFTNFIMQAAQEAAYKRQLFITEKHFEDTLQKLKDRKVQALSEAAKSMYH